MTTDKQIKELNLRIEELDRLKEKAVAEQRFDNAALYRDRADELREEKKQLVKLKKPMGEHEAAIIAGMSYAIANTATKGLAEMFQKALDRYIEEL